MSTSFLIPETLHGVARIHGVTIVEVLNDDPTLVRCADDPEPDHQIFGPGQARPFFQGDLDRCSDFMRGWIASREAAR